jgi:hypothetical protein
MFSKFVGMGLYQTCIANETRLQEIETEKCSKIYKIRVDKAN